MKRILLTAVLASLAASALFAPSVMAGEGKPVAAASQEEKTALREIEAAYSQIAAAIARKDLKGTLAYRTENYVTIAEDGRRISRAEEEKNAAEGFAIFDSIRAWNAIQGFTFNGDTATVVVRTGITLVLPASKNQKRSVFKGTSRGVDTWVKRDGKWMVAQGKVFASYATVDGKVLPKQ